MNLMIFKLFCFFNSFFITSLLHDMHLLYLTLSSDREAQMIFLHFLQTSRMFLSHSTKFKFKHSGNDRCCETKFSRMSIAFWGAALKRLVLLFAWIKKESSVAGTYFFSTGRCQERKENTYSIPVETTFWLFTTFLLLLEQDEGRKEMTSSGK